ncbi:MAG TPA: phosphoribosyltransferase family protein [Bacteroidia bacterium]|nr:phosphoribosyltransferase family protein [Bacteroidia bacterium]
MASATLKQLGADFISLFFPVTCAACNGELVRGEEAICTSCLSFLPRTSDENDPRENPVARVFWGRVPLQCAASAFLFSKGGSVQELIHNLKYNGRKDAGIAAGKFFGNDLKKLTPFNSVDAVVPVPLHSEKFRKRGYNQAACFGQGIAHALGVPLLGRAVLRMTATETQTRKSRTERWSNVEDVFRANPEINVSGKHILLVDDVITTGATIEACASALLACEGTSVSVVSLASARE